MAALPGRCCWNPSPSFPTGLLPGSHSACEGCTSGGASPGCSQRLRCVPAPSWASRRDTPSLQHNHRHVLKQPVPTVTPLLLKYTLMFLCPLFKFSSLF